MVEIKQLASLLEDKELHKRLVGAFKGAYSVGIGADPDHPGRPALVLHVEGDSPPHIAPSIQFGKDSVRVITKTGFRVPKPL
jgi:hypothetical protein